MALTLTDIDRIAHLSRLALPDAERAPMLERLNGFFGLVEAMRAVDTTGVEPLAHPLGGAPGSDQSSCPGPVNRRPMAPLPSRQLKSKTSPSPSTRAP